MFAPRLCLVAVLVAAAVPVQASAKERAGPAASLRDASREQVAEALPPATRSAILAARNRKQYVASSLAFARTAAGADGLLTEADARGLAPDDPRAVQIRYYLKTPYLKSYYTPRKIGSRTVPRLSVQKVGQVAGATWDKFDENRDGVLSVEEKAPLQVARGGSAGGRPSF
ncbi:hypothetical protein [Microvirga thermotolerans]|uniref:EF-hand domain-containing protein n=1 Tax=Microvirga thermotolerans TaxID=2651334 RepID=A0A5P9JT95_9HYPH|nr:hypothetical protein [Microvirga thermotolerans]QFU15857.1 hypothetical protein GDR74_06265 [Microvirga thermotolerans]